MKSITKRKTQDGRSLLKHSCFSSFLRRRLGAASSNVAESPSWVLAILFREMTVENLGTWCPCFKLCRPDQVQDAREAKVGSRELCIRSPRRNLAHSRSRSCQEVAAKLGVGWRLATLASGSDDVVGCRGFAGESDGEERWRWRGEKRSEAVLRSTRVGEPG